MVVVETDAFYVVDGQFDLVFVTAPNHFVCLYLVVCYRFFAECVDAPPPESGHGVRATEWSLSQYRPQPVEHSFIVVKDCVYPETLLPGASALGINLGPAEQLAAV